MSLSIPNPILRIVGIVATLQVDRGTVGQITLNGNTEALVKSTFETKGFTIIVTITCVVISIIVTTPIIAASVIVSATIVATPAVTIFG